MELATVDCLSISALHTLLHSKVTETLPLKSMNILLQIMHKLYSRGRPEKVRLANPLLHQVFCGCCLQVWGHQKWNDGWNTENL